MINMLNEHDKYAHEGITQQTITISLEPTCLDQH